MFRASFPEKVSSQFPNSGLLYVFLFKTEKRNNFIDSVVANGTSIGFKGNKQENEEFKILFKIPLR